MEEVVQQIISWIYPLLSLAMIVVAATRGNFRGKPLLMGHLAISLLTMILWRVPRLLMSLDLIDDPSRFYMLCGIPLNVLGLVGYGLLLGFIITVSSRSAEPPIVAEPVQDAPPMTIPRALFSFEGRLSRSDYWMKGFLPLLPVGILNNILAYGIATEGAQVVSMTIAILMLWPGMALVVKRLHDRNRSGWFAATMLIPFAGIVFAIWILVEVWFSRGTMGPNRFGNDPTPQ